MFSCGALLTATSASAAEEPTDNTSLIQRLVGADLGTVIRALPGVFCGNRLIAYNSPSPNSPTKCVNGPEDSGNSTNSGNYHNEGNAINSGNFSNTNGSTGSSNNSNGGNTANGPQHVSPAG
ncbi:hypothetical protein ITP53_05905 [Nonomuraea sp. K274]|uniref:Uncharacterized protein n=2 Tax=Nonomuraea cypriaca TaxID=1187855 RepID=A0A931A2Y8_9ACTN|nr:hypothetical protein [Nonomuraea cypriaca]